MQILPAHISCKQRELIRERSGLTVSLLLSNNALALAVQELQMICHHPLLAFVNDFGVRAGVQVLPTSDLFIFQPSQNLQKDNSVLFV